jgi:hypothetical protein
VALAANASSCGNDLLPSDAKPGQSELAKAKVCVSKGLEYANKAVELGPENDSAWSYKASLLRLELTIAKAENETTKLASIENEFTEARDRARELSDARWDELDAENEKELSVPRVSASPKITAEGIEELTEYSEEKPLDALIKELYFPLALYGPDPSNRSDDEKPEYEQPRDWRSYSPNEEVTLDLPETLSPPDSNSFDSQGNGVSYVLIYPLRVDPPVPIPDDMTLNVLAWTTVDAQKGWFLRDDKTTKFEATLLNKENIGGRPARSYFVRSTSCSKTHDGTILLIVGPKRNYAITIFGAALGDPRVDRVVKSIRFRS